MDLPNSSQVSAFGRHVLSYSMGAVSAAAVLHVISAGDATTIGNSISQISTGVAEIAAGLAPIIALVSGWYAAWSASHKSQIASVNAIPGVKVVAQAVPAITLTAPPK